MEIDLWALYGKMLRCRLFEEAVARLWHDGLISGEMHLGTGEEAVIAGVISHLRSGDALALDHRGTAALLMHGVDAGLILRELLGVEDALCNGMGGHMHLFSKEHLAASSGIVGAAGPAAAGFALALQQLAPGAVASAFFGEGALNQGMLMEAMNLASVWRLPVVFVCKNDTWSITTHSVSVTGGDLNERARGLGVPAAEVDGLDVHAVWEAAGAAIERARSGQGPSFLNARCIHLEGHFLGFQLIRTVRQPLKEIPGITRSLGLALFQRGGAGLAERIAGVKMVLETTRRTQGDPRRDPANDPLLRARKAVLADPTAELVENSKRLRALEDQLRQEIESLTASVLGERLP